MFPSRTSRLLHAEPGEESLDRQRTDDIEPGLGDRFGLLRLVFPAGVALATARRGRTRKSSIENPKSKIEMCP